MRRCWTGVLVPRSPVNGCCCTTATTRKVPGVTLTLFDIVSKSSNLVNLVLLIFFYFGLPLSLGVPEWI